MTKVQTGTTGVGCNEIRLDQTDHPLAPLATPPAPRRAQQKQFPIRLVRWIAAALFSLFAWCGVAEANVLPYFDALLVVQDWTLSWENSVAYQDLVGPIATYDYRASNSSNGWSGSLSGATLAVTYIGDASSYSTNGKMSWDVQGTVGGAPYKGTGTAQFIDVPGDTSFKFTIDATEGSTILSFVMTGLVEEFAPGRPVVKDASTWGTLSIDGVPVFLGWDWIIYPSGDDYKTPRGGYSLVSYTPGRETTIGQLFVVPAPSTLTLLVAGILSLLLVSADWSRKACYPRAS